VPLLHDARSNLVNISACGLPFQPKTNGLEFGSELAVIQANDIHAKLKEPKVVPL
jgi:hypothetical protein